MKLIFTGPSDLANTWGKIEFGANTLSLVAQAGGLPPLSRLCFAPQSDLSCFSVGLGTQLPPYLEFPRYVAANGRQFDTFVALVDNMSEGTFRRCYHGKCA